MAVSFKELLSGVFADRDPFGDTTANTGKAVAPAAPKTIMPVPQRPVENKSTLPAKLFGGRVGTSPITMQGAVSIPAQGMMADPYASVLGSAPYMSYLDDSWLDNYKKFYTPEGQAVDVATFLDPETQQLIAEYDQSGLSDVLFSFDKNNNVDVGRKNSLEQITGFGEFLDFEDWSEDESEGILDRDEWFRENRRTASPEEYKNYLDGKKAEYQQYVDDYNASKALFDPNAFKQQYLAANPNAARRDIEQATLNEAARVYNEKAIADSGFTQEQLDVYNQSLQAKEDLQKEQASVLAQQKAARNQYARENNNIDLVASGLLRADELDAMSASERYNATKDSPLDGRGYRANDYLRMIEQVAYKPADEQEAYIENWKQEKSQRYDGLIEKEKEEYATLTSDLLNSAKNLGVSGLSVDDIDWEAVMSSGFRGEKALKHEVYSSSLNSLDYGNSSYKDIENIRKELAEVDPMGGLGVSKEERDFGKLSTQEKLNAYVNNYKELPEGYTLGELSSAFGASDSVEIDPNVRITSRDTTKYGLNLSNDQYQQYNAILKDIMIGKLSGVPSGSYGSILEEALFSDPKVIALKAVFGLPSTAGTRSTKDGSRYVKDPITGGEIRTLEVKDKTLLDSAFEVAAIGLTFAGMPMAAAAVAGTGAARQGGDIEDVLKASVGTYIGAQAGAGQGMFANAGAAIAPTASLSVQTAISTGIASGVSTAVQGGDTDDILKGGVLGATGGFLKGAADEAAMLQDATNAALEVGDSVTALQYADEARKITAQADIISTVANSAKAIDSALEGDYASAIKSGLQAGGTNLTEFTSKHLTGMFGEEAFANLNIDDVAAGVNKVATSLIEGKDIEEALKKGVTTYVQKGGSLGEAGDQVRDYLESAGGALYENVIKPAGDMLTGLVDNVSSFDTPEGIKAIEDAVRAAGVAVDDTVLQAVKEGAESIYEPLETPDAIKGIEDVTKVAGSAAEDVVRDTGSAIDDTILQPVKDVVETAYEAIPNPDVNLPDVNLPNVSAPNINIDLSGMFDNLMAYLPSQQQQRRAAVPQQTTDPVLADLSDLYIQQAEPEELLATRDYLSGLLRTI